MKKITTILLAGTASILMTACGSGGSSDGGSSTLPSTVVGSKAAYLIDEQWNSFGEVNYNCKGTMQTTTPDSKFYYDNGDVCTFYMPAGTEDAWFLQENGTRLRGLKYKCYGEGECTIPMG